MPTPTNRSLILAAAITAGLTLPATLYAGDPARGVACRELKEPPTLLVHDIAPAPEAPPAAPAAALDAAASPLIQVALLLDTSNSMDGLIDQAKAQLWMIVNRFAKAQRDGLDPNFQIALFEYGNNALPAEEGYIRQVIGFTHDLDAVSARLFALQTNGGDEYCGQVIDETLTRLDWSAKPNDFKAVYIAGNEPFTQGPVHYVGVSKRAKDKGVLVNTIHCGPQHQGIAGKWQHGAHLTGGSYLTINQDRAVAVPSAPQDDRLALLNTELNKTYVPYGEEGESAVKQQREVDRLNSKLSGDAAAERAASKAGRLYRNERWDLVDAAVAEPGAKSSVELQEVPDEQLPEAMRGMTLKQKRAYLTKQSELRRKIQKQIQALAAERAAFVAAERARQARQEGASLGEAVQATIDEQLKSAGFEVVEAAPENAGPAAE